MFSESPTARHLTNEVRLSSRTYTVASAGNSTICGPGFGHNVNSCFALSGEG